MCACVVGACIGQNPHAVPVVRLVQRWWAIICGWLSETAWALSQGFAKSWGGCTIVRDLYCTALRAGWAG